uniref:BTB domain-containing protein n=1 Tax=Rhabditophanes sp. KR3021 TaxID=114890 RepID=A0AC35U413_9BILA
MDQSYGDLSVPSASASFPFMSPTNSSQTEIRVAKVSHSWTVKNFSHCYQEYLENFVFLTHGKETMQWSIKIYPQGNGENNKDFVFLCLNKVQNNCSKAKNDFQSKFTLKNSIGEEIEMRIHPNPSHSDYVAYIKRETLCPKIMADDTIVVLIEIDVGVETVTTIFDDSAIPCTCASQLSDDFSKLIDGNLTDFVVQIGKHEIGVHKAILAARSPVFNAMMAHSDARENISGIVKIEDIEHEVFMELLIFIYSGKFAENKKELAADLMIAADKYGLIELRNHCETSLVNSISDKNVCQLLILADLYNLDRLRKACLQLIILKPKDVTNSKGWHVVVKQHPELVTDIVRNFDKSTCSSNDPDQTPVTPPILHVNGSGTAFN